MHLLIFFAHYFVMGHLTVLLLRYYNFIITNIVFLFVPFKEPAD